MYANGIPEGAKVSRLAQWKQVEKTTGFKPQAMLDKPEFPYKLFSLWNRYTKLVGNKAPLTYVEIEAYMRVTNTVFSPWEIGVIFKLEAARNG